MKKMISEGVGYKTIARQLKMSRTTVRNYAALDSLPAKFVSFRNDYNNYLRHIEQGLSGGATLQAIYKSIIDCGFKESYSAFAAQFKDHPLRHTNSKSNSSTTSNATHKISIISPRKISFYLSLSKFTKIQSESTNNKTGKE